VSPIILHGLTAHQAPTRSGKGTSWTTQGFSEHQHLLL